MAGAGLTAQQVFSPSTVLMRSDEVPLAQAMDDLPFDLLLSGCGRTHSAALSAKRRALVFRLKKNLWQWPHACSSADF
jgi:hypothetical protein